MHFIELVVAVAAPLIANAIVIYALIPDVFKRRRRPSYRVLAAVLIVIATIASFWAAHAAYLDQKYLSAWRAQEDLYNIMNSAWRDYESTFLDASNLSKGTAVMEEANELMRQGKSQEGEAKMNEALALMNDPRPDKDKMTKLANDMHELIHVADRPGITQELGFRTLLFCVTLETLVRLRSEPGTPPLSIFSSMIEDVRASYPEKFGVTPGWSKFLWSVGFFQPSDFGDPQLRVRVDEDGRIVVDPTGFDEAFLRSRAELLHDWFLSAAR